jgi:hypothetical protein
MLDELRSALGKQSPRRLGQGHVALSCGAGRRGAQRCDAALSGARPLHAPVDRVRQPRRASD